MLPRLLAGMLVLACLLSLVAHAQETDADAATPLAGSEMPGIEDFLPAYPLSVGDTIVVTYYTPSRTQYRVTIDGNGTIVIPPAGRVEVIGLTIEEASALLEQELAPYYRSVVVAIDLFKLSPVRVFVFGATDKAGVYTLKGGTTMMEFLQQLKMKSWGQYRQIHHFRFTSFFLGNEGAPGSGSSGFLLGTGQAERSRTAATGAPATEQLSAEELQELVNDEEAFFSFARLRGAEVTVIDPTDFVALGELKRKNFLLRDGDIIYFQRPGVSVTVVGTTRPGVYEVLPEEGLLEILKRAGEVMPENDLAHTVIERVGPGGELAFQIVGLDRYYFSQEEPPLIPLANGDRVKVFPHNQFVAVLGAVNQAGRLPYDPTFGIFDYIAAAGGNADGSRMSKIMVARGAWRGDGSFELARSFIVNADDYAAGHITELPAILPGDVIYVPVRDELAKRDIASILANLTISALALFK